MCCCCCHRHCCHCCCHCHCCHCCHCCCHCHCCHCCCPCCCPPHCPWCSGHRAARHNTPAGTSHRSPHTPQSRPVSAAAASTCRVAGAIRSRLPAAPPSAWPHRTRAGCEPLKTGQSPAAAPLPPPARCRCCCRALLLHLDGQVVVTETPCLMPTCPGSTLSHPHGPWGSHHLPRRCPGHVARATSADPCPMRVRDGRFFLTHL